MRAALARALLALLPCAGLAQAAPAPTAPAPADSVIPGLQPWHLDAEYWVARADAADAPVLGAEAIAARNAELVAHDDSVHALDQLPARHTRRAVAALVGNLSAPPSGVLFDQAGEPLTRQALAAIVANAAAGAIPAQAQTRWGLVVRRADMRSFPTRTRVFRTAHDHDIDRFQETGLFPGTPLALLHESRDGDWWFAVSPRYSAWIEKRHVAVGARGAVLDYGRRSPYLVVTGAEVATVFTPEAPRVSERVLDMGVRLPLLADWLPNRPVNGQHPFAAHVVELPVREADGTLGFAPALVPRSADVARGYLPLTRANLIRQAFKFLGERYGWGHSYGARDCSGFVSEVYRSFGVRLPRNTSDQAVATVFERIVPGEGVDVARKTRSHSSNSNSNSTGSGGTAGERAARVALLRTLQVGDLVYIPGHVMMVIGQDASGPFVIHDTTGTSVLDADGSLRRVPLNGVVVTPLLPLHSDADTLYADRVTSIQRMLPAASSATASPQARPPQGGP